MSNSNSNGGSGAAAGGIGFCGLLTIVFITLKLTHVIDWNWLIVLSPLYVPFVLVFIGVLLFVVIISGKDKSKKKRISLKKR